MGGKIRFRTYIQRVHIGNSNKNTSVALKLDVDLDQKDRAMQYMDQLKFDGNYSRLVFHLFVTSNMIPYHEVQQYLQAHNTYQCETRKKDIRGILSEKDIMTLKYGRKFSIDSLYLLQEVNWNNAFHSVGQRFKGFYLMNDTKDENVIEEELEKMNKRIETQGTIISPIL